MGQCVGEKTRGQWSRPCGYLSGTNRRQPFGRGRPTDGSRVPEARVWQLRRRWNVCHGFTLTADSLERQDSFRYTSGTFVDLVRSSRGALVIQKEELWLETLDSTEARSDGRN